MFLKQNHLGNQSSVDSSYATAPQALFSLNQPTNLGTPTQSHLITVIELNDSKVLKLLVNMHQLYTHKFYSCAKLSAMQ